MVKLMFGTYYKYIIRINERLSIRYRAKRRPGGDANEIDRVKTMRESVGGVCQRRGGQMTRKWGYAQNLYIILLIVN
jgi:hypothetical protein